LHAPDISNPSDAIAASKAVRERVRRMPANDPDRRGALTASLGLLGECWTPEHEAYVRSLPRSAASVDDDPVRVVGRARRTEMKALRDALKPRSGTPRPRPRIVPPSRMEGIIGKVRQIAYGIDREHEQLRLALGRGEPRRSANGGTFRSMAPLNTEARRLLAELTKTRRRLNTEFARYEHDAMRLAQRGHRLARIRESVEETRVYLAQLADRLRQSVKCKRPLKPGRRPPGTWTRERVEQILTSYAKTHGRLPTRRELDDNPTLPHYTQLRRWYGDRPLTSSALQQMVS